MYKRSNSRVRPWAARAAMVIVLAPGFCYGADPTVFASGLQNPSKIIAGPAGTFVVTETGKDPNSGRVTRLTAAGVTQVLLDGLPSGLSAPNLDPDGVNGLALLGNTLFVAIGEGDTLVSGTAPRTTIANPKGPSSPLLDCVLQVVFSTSIDRLISGFTLKAADHFTLIDGNPVTLTNDAGDKATVTLLALFRARPDPVAIYRNSHPYGLAMFPSDPSRLFMVDAGLNNLVQIDAQSGKSRTLVHFANVPNLSGAPPTSEAVPDSVKVYGNQLLVTLLTGGPFTPGDSRVMIVDPATGDSNVFIALLSSTIDVLFRVKQNGAGQFLVLEFSANLLGGAAGRVKVYDSPQGQVLVDNLKTPSSMTLDAATGNLYITDRTDGTVLMANVGQ